MYANTFMMSIPEPPSKPPAAHALTNTGRQYACKEATDKTIAEETAISSHCRWEHTDQHIVNCRCWMGMMQHPSCNKSVCKTS